MGGRKANKTCCNHTVVFCVNRTHFAIAWVLYHRRDDLYNEDGTVKPQPLDILYAIYHRDAYYYESVQMAFKLALWSALVFFEHGSEMQLGVALIVNVMQLCVHQTIMPMGGSDAALLNIMLTGTLVLTTYINFGGFSKCADHSIHN